MRSSSGTRLSLPLLAAALFLSPVATEKAHALGRDGQLSGTVWLANPPWLYVPARGARVEALDSSGRVIGVTYSDGNGFYQFRGLPSVGSVSVRGTLLYQGTVYRGTLANCAYFNPFAPNRYPALGCNFNLTR